MAVSLTSRPERDSCIELIDLLDVDQRNGMCLSTCGLFVTFEFARTMNVLYLVTNPGLSRRSLDPLIYKKLKFYHSYSVFEITLTNSDPHPSMLRSSAPEHLGSLSSGHQTTPKALKPLTTSASTWTSQFCSKASRPPLAATAASSFCLTKTFISSLRTGSA